MSAERITPVFSEPVRWKSVVVLVKNELVPISSHFVICRPMLIDMPYRSKPVFFTLIPQHYYKYNFLST